MYVLLPLLLFILSAPVVWAQKDAKPYERERMAAAISTYQAMLNAGSWHVLPETLLIKPGDTSRFVQPLQENLVLTGDLHPDSVKEKHTYTPALQLAVKNFQTRHGLIADGVLGPNTIKAINVPLSQRLAQLQQNMARWDTVFFNVSQPYIVINLPDYTLQVVDSNTTVLNMRVIIGKPELKTYPILSELNMLVFYPYWYIPKSIAVNEIVPLLRKNPGYLYKKRMRLEKQTSRGWVRLNPYGINWNNINADNYTYRMLQLSGKENELGQVKFLYNNKLPQYMHDTPNKELFAYPNRTFSHGCIRLEKPFELADFVLKRGNGYTPEKVANLWRTSDDNYYLKVKEPLPLHIVYLTAWVDEFMRVQFREDMYGLFATPDSSSE